MLQGLKDEGATTIVAIHTVGGITQQCYPGLVFCPKDIIDYTSGRGVEEAATQNKGVWDRHPDCSDLFDEKLRRAITARLRHHGNVSCLYDFVMGVTQGPRLETPAEIQRMKRDGCDVVGMTAMPEALFAKHLGMRYVSIAVVANWAAGIGKTPINLAAMKQVVEQVEPYLAMILHEAFHQ
jgi:purine nucleoside phosphorylase